jgi:hypothetical protein
MKRYSMENDNWHRWLGWLLILSPLLIFLLGNHVAAAQTASPSMWSVRNACRSDIRSVCAGIMPGGGRIKQCMIEKRDQLSAACKSALANARTSAKN